MIRILFSILLLRHGPEDLPASSRLLQVMIVFNLLTGIVVMITRYDIYTSVFSTLLDLALSLGFASVLLLFLNRRSRFIQTAIALCGIGAIFHLLLWPLLIITGRADQAEQKVLWIFMLLMTSGELLVIAHIFRRAIESSMASAIALSFGLFLISIIVSQLIFPGV